MSELENKGTEWCEPTVVDLGAGEVAASEPCPEADKEPAEICCCDSPKACPVHLEYDMSFDKADGCPKHPCIASIPPDLGCIPVKVGVGKWDGGVPAWMHACTTGCELEVLEAKHPNFIKAIMSQGQSLLDLDTNPESTTNLQVIGSNYVPRQINIREFMALSVKMYQTGMAVTGAVDPSSLSMGYVEAADGSMMLSILADGVAVGSGLALDVTKDGAGVVTGVALPLPK